MTMNSKLTFAIAAILGSASFAGHAADSANTEASSSDTLEEITVTAQRRSQSMQDVPISMQAFTGQALAQLNVTTFDDYIKYLPNVSSANNGPGQNEIFMRGLSAGAQPSQGSGSTAVYPNVALYLDNQSGQLPGRNLDVYAADLDRIEVLEGPQGTLFGSGAEAGAIRYITNAPKLGVTEGSVKGGYGVTAHGDPNTDVTAVINLPLWGDQIAVRAVVYDDRRGGYIDNVPATFTRKNTDVGIHYAQYPAVNGVCPDGLPNNGYCVPPGSPVANNLTSAARAFNPAEYQGIRAELLYKINDDWDVLLSQSYQNLNTQGVFYQQPTASDGQALQPLEVTVFNPSYDKDNFESTAWTLNGKVGPLHLVYTGGYLVRHVEQVGDYTNYSRGVYADYYQCYGPGSGENNNLVSTCYSPAVIWRSVERNDHLQNEIRLSTPDDWRLRAIVGVFNEDNKLYDQSDWRYKTVPPCTSNDPAGTGGNSGCFSLIGTDPGATVVNPGVRDPNSSFYQDDVRETKQTAIFASMDFDLIPKVLTFTAGTRWYEFKNSFRGSVTGSFYCFQSGVSPAGCLNDDYGLQGQNLHDVESGFKSRGNLTYHITPDIMVYATYSQGFRPGGFNQNGGTSHAFDANGVAQYILPAAYHSDKLTNKEVGWKTEFFDRRLQWNGAYYHENWNNVQVALFQSGLLGNVFFDTNGQNFVLKGLETSIVAKPLRGVTLQAAASWNQSRQTNSPALVNNNKDSPTFGQTITQSCGGSAFTGDCEPVSNPFGPIGSPTANSPPLQFSLRARYDWNIGDYGAFVQGGAVHSGHSFTQAGSNPTFAQQTSITTGRLRFEDPAYSTFDASVGIAKDAWTAAFVGENLSNSNAAVFTSTDQFIVAQTPLRPRTLGITMSYKF
jgi:iron complex outermembrane receptor protein